MTERVERLARLLGEHWPNGTYEGPSGEDLWYSCSCGFAPPNCEGEELQAHLASVLAGEFEQTAAKVERLQEKVERVHNAIETGERFGWSDGHILANVRSAMRAALDDDTGGGA